MKPMQLNMSKMKKVAGDKHSSTFQHEDGHMIKVAHAALPALQRKQLEKLPIKVQHFDDGGIASSLVDSVKSAFSTPTPTPTPSSSDDKHEAIRKQNRANFDSPSNDKSGGFAKGGMVKMADGGSIMNEPAAQSLGYAPEQPLAAPDTVQMNPGDAQGPNPTTPQSSGTSGSWDPTPQPQPQGTEVDKAYNMGLNAIGKEGDLKASLAKQDAEILQNDMTAQKAFLDQVQTSGQEHHDHQEALMSDYANGHINPNAYMESMGTGQRIKTAIGLLLGGISTGLGGKSNPAMDFLNAQIGRDIDAQKESLGQKKTLLEANHQLYGDDVLAQNQTRIAQNNFTQHQIDLAAAKNGSPQALNAAQMSKSQFMIQNAGLKQQSDMRAGVLKNMQAGGGGVTAQNLAMAGFMTPEEANKEQSSIDGQKQSIAQVKNIFANLNAEQTWGNRIMHPIDSHEEIGQLNAQLTNVLMKAAPSGRLSPEAAKAYVEPYATKLYSGKTTRADALQGVLDTIKTVADPTPNMKQYAPGSLPNYSVPEDQSADQQAAAYATSPKTRGTPQAAAIRAKLGLR